jgi:hypothetical protein
MGTVNVSNQKLDFSDNTTIDPCLNSKNNSTCLEPAFGSSSGNLIKNFLEGLHLCGLFEPLQIHISE